MFHQWRIQNL